MVEKSNSKNALKTSEIQKFFENIPWNWIFIGIVIIIVSFAIVKVVQALNSILSPLLQAFGGVLRSFNDILEDCIVVGDCSGVYGCDICKTQPGNGCACDSENKCQNIKPKGSGGFFQCGLGIVSLIAAGIFVLVRLVSNWKASETCADSAARKGLSETEYCKPLYEKTQADIKSTKDEYEKKNGPLSADEAFIIETRIAEGNVLQDSYNISKNTISDPAERIDAYNKAQFRYESNIRDAQVKLENLSTETKNNIEDAVKKFDPIKPK